MAQPNSAANFVIQDANGQPQVIKLVQTGKVGGLMGPNMTGHPIKILKAHTNDQDGSNQIVTAASQVIKFSAPTKLKAVPMGTLAQLQQRSADGQIFQKLVRIAPTTNKIKVYNPANTQKLQINQSVLSSSVMPPASSVPQPNHKTFTAPPILDHTGARKRQEPLESEFAPEYKRRKTEKVGKGLRHFSMKVCEKVRNKGTTSYNEVADELVGEFTDSLNSTLADQQYDQKNIRRRVYDALNVLMAMNIISKEKKEIRWLGLPTNSLQECLQLEREKQRRIQSIREKTRKLQDLILNQIAFKSLARRNKNLETLHGPPAPSSFIQLPFIVVNTNKKTVIDCSISNDKMEYLFQFNDKFEIHDDLYILKQIGMLMGLEKGECSLDDLEKIKGMVPKSLEDYVMNIANGDHEHPDDLLSSLSPGPSCMPFLNAEDLVETQMDDDNSRQSSSFDAMSTGGPEDYSEDEVEGESDFSSDVDAN